MTQSMELISDTVTAPFTSAAQGAVGARQLQLSTTGAGSGALQVFIGDGVPAESDWVTVLTYSGPGVRKWNGVADAVRVTVTTGSVSRAVVALIEGTTALPMSDAEVQNALSEIEQVALDASSAAEYATDQGDYAQTQGDYALAQGSTIDAKLTVLRGVQRTDRLYTGLTGYKDGTGSLTRFQGGSAAFVDVVEDEPLRPEQAQKKIRFTLTGAATPSYFAMRSDIRSPEFPSARFVFGAWFRKADVLAINKNIDLLLWSINSGGSAIRQDNSPALTPAQFTTVGTDQSLTSGGGVTSRIRVRDEYLGYVWVEVSVDAAPPALTVYVQPYVRLNATTGASGTLDILGPVVVSGENTLSPYAIYAEDATEHDPVGVLKVVDERTRSAAVASQVVLYSKSINLCAGYTRGVGVIDLKQNNTTSTPLHDGTGPYPSAERIVRWSYGATTSDAYGDFVALDDGSFTTGLTVTVLFWVRKTNLASLTGASMKFLVRFSDASNATLGDLGNHTITKANMQVVGSTNFTDGSGATAGIRLTTTVTDEVDGWMGVRMSVNGLPSGTAKVKWVPKVTAPSGTGTLDLLGPVCLPDATDVDHELFYAESQQELDFSSRISTLEDTVAALSKSPYPTGLKVVGLGDSFMAGTSDGSVDATRSWMNRVCALRSWTPVNKGIGGSTMTDVSASVSGRNPMVLRYATDVVAEAPSIVFVCAGLNDWTYNAPLGNMRNLAATTTFVGAYYTTLKGILDGTSADVYVLTAPDWHVTEWYQETNTFNSQLENRWRKKNTLGVYLEDYRALTREVVDYLKATGYDLRLTMMDWGHDMLGRIGWKSGGDYWDASGGTPGSGNHPSVNGYYDMADYVFSKLR